MNLHLNCNFKISVASELVCDFIINCDNGEDEMNCTDGRFYCESGNPLFVRERKVSYFITLHFT